MALVSAVSQNHRPGPAHVLAGRQGEGAGLGYLLCLGAAQACRGQAALTRVSVGSVPQQQAEALCTRRGAVVPGQMGAGPP